MKKKSTFKRLSKDILPVEYTITLKPDLEAHVFEGEEIISIRILKPTKKLVLHSKDLEIVFSEVKKGKTLYNFSSVSYNDIEETLTYIFPKNLDIGVYTLHVVFRGVLSETMRGFYKSHYTIDGKKHTMATTQFEATDARRCIPCFDEPSHKAIFHIKLVVPVGKEAISNTLPTSIVEHEAGFKVVSFAPTPKMSTYLLAFIVGDMEYIEAKTSRGVLVRVFTTPGKKEQGKFALSVATKCIDFYEKYFDIKYPLPVLDMIAVPDFESGAMENWGAVTYRETALLVDDLHTSLRAKQYVAIVVAHELAHQWFGNLVTMEWWTHLWLNEGFASYIEYLAVDHLFPEWNMWQQFIIDDHNVALSLDALSHTHPIEVPIHHPGEISEIFDKISYSKGASVIRMLARYIGEKAFRDGLRYYLKKHSYQNTETIHLWEAFEKVSKKPIQKMMAGWTMQSGFPLINVNLSKSHLICTQERFLLDGTNSQKEKWMVPFNYITDRTRENSKEKTVLLSTKQTKIIPREDCNWLLINPEQQSFFISSYDTALLDRLYTAVLNKRISSIDRLSLLRDLRYLLLSRKVGIEKVLGFLEAYTGESEYIVWVEIAQILTILRNLIYGTDKYDSFALYVQKLIQPTFEMLGYSKRTNESSFDTFLRSLILSLATKYDLPGVRKHAVSLFKEREINPIDPDIRAFVYYTLGLEGNKSSYSQLFEMYLKEELHEEKNRIIAGLCSFISESLLKKTMLLVHSDDVRLQDRFRAYAALLGQRETQLYMWEYIQIHWEGIKKSYGETSHSLSRIVEYLDGITDERVAKDIRKFFEKQNIPGIKRTVDQTLEKIMIHLKVKKQYQKELLVWFKQKNFKR